MRQSIEMGKDRTVNLIDSKPRIASLANLCVLFMMGSAIGLGLFLVTWNFTSQFDKPWVYVMNTLIAMTIKLLLQWFVVLYRYSHGDRNRQDNWYFERTGNTASPRTPRDSIDSPYAKQHDHYRIGYYDSRYRALSRRHTANWVH